MLKDKTLNSYLEIKTKPNDKRFEEIDPKKNIVIVGAKVNNLKGLSVAIPRNKLIVMTGLSGSGKSSLAFDTLYAEGQRMYIESLSSYARQFLGRQEKPKVDYIRGISPAIGLVQKTSGKNVHSTVGTTTEIYDYLKLLYARIGETYSPISNEKVSKDSVESVVNTLLKLEKGTKIIVTAPLTIHEGRTLGQEIELLLSKGFTRIIVDNTPYYIEELLDSKKQKKYLSKAKNTTVVIDRVVIKKDNETQSRLSDSVQIAFYEGMGVCHIQNVGKKTLVFSNKFERDGIVFEEPTVNFFSFNNPYGACKRCQGYGNILGIDPQLVIPDQSKTIYENAVVPWKSASMSKYKNYLISVSEETDVPIHKPIIDFTEKEKEALWYGKGNYNGIFGFFKILEAESYKIQYRILLSRYKGKTECPDCKGTRLRKDTQYVKIGGYSIYQLVSMPIYKLQDAINDIKLSDYQSKVASRILTEIKNRIGYLLRVGLGYLTLNRLSHTLSGGEYQRVKLSTSLGSTLVGAMYILDEPSIGLHPRDTHNLIEVLQQLKSLGNTVVVVEHEEEIMRAADQIIDIGPNAGTDGGMLMFQGSIKEAKGGGVNSHTINYLTGKATIRIPKQRRSWRNSISITGVCENNLSNISATFPLSTFTVVTGVSGSGKSTLVERVLYSAMRKYLGMSSQSVVNYGTLTGDLSCIQSVEFVDQKSIGKSSRSNPVSYVKAYDGIRQLYASRGVAKNKYLTPSSFSFNVEGGRCDGCDGEGVERIEMQFMADVVLTCSECKGKRFKKEVLEVRYKGKNIYDVLNMTVDEALEFFADHKGIFNRLLPLQEVGMGYIRLGQASNTLSGGEAQRVKLATYLLSDTARKKETKMYIFDEPTTGLHFHDINKLLKSLNALVDNGHTVIVIEHNLDVVKSADWIIDMGPDAGDKGGEVVFCGTPDDLCKEKSNITGHYLALNMNK